jgi:adenylate kinase family enzyme
MDTQSGKRPRIDRIMIVGQPGSGKSTLARRLGQRTGLPVIHIDKIHWLPNWIERSPEEKTRLCNEAAAADRWIFEGGHSATWADRVARADMLIWLDRPVGLRLWRVVRRSLTGRGKTRPDLTEDCPERLRLLPEFIAYIWKTRRSSRAQIARLAAASTKNCEVVHLISDQQVDNFVREFRE